MKVHEFVKNVYAWAAERQLPYGTEGAHKQMWYTWSEFGELADAILKNKDELADAIGDVAVTLVTTRRAIAERETPVTEEFAVFMPAQRPMLTPGILARVLVRFQMTPTVEETRLAMTQLGDFASMHGLELETCLETAWNAIKDRKGKIVNGHFQKEESK